jgi:uracil-DNA glycosylase
VLCLGRLAFDAVMLLYRQRGWTAQRGRLSFAHGAAHRFDAAPTVLCSYHPSQQNTFTGRLTRRMLLDVFMNARRLL